MLWFNIYVFKHVGFLAHHSSNSLTIRWWCVHMFCRAIRRIRRLGLGEGIGACNLLVGATVRNRFLGRTTTSVRSRRRPRVLRLGAREEATAQCKQMTRRVVIAPELLAEHGSGSGSVSDTSAGAWCRNCHIQRLAVPVFSDRRRAPLSPRKS